MKKTQRQFYVLQYRDKRYHAEPFFQTTRVRSHRVKDPVKAKRYESPDLAVEVARRKRSPTTLVCLRFCYETTPVLVVDPS